MYFSQLSSFIFFNISGRGGLEFIFDSTFGSLLVILLFVPALPSLCPGWEVSLCRGSCWLMIHGVRSTPSPADEFGWFALVPGVHWADFRKTPLPSKNSVEFGSLGLALSAGSGFKTYTQSRKKWLYIPGHPGSRSTIQVTASNWYRNHKKVYFLSQTSRARHPSKVWNKFLFPNGAANRTLHRFVHSNI